MLPLSLHLKNYCQHKDLTLDLTKGAIIGITAPNGSGKSNIFYGLRYALTGESTPGARQLSDDIYDGAHSATVELTFRINAKQTGRIRRTLHRKGANQAELELYDETGKIVATYSKSKEAAVQFETILGVSPKYLCEIIIAEQRSIDELLFASPTSRREKFQRLLQGDTFVNRTTLLKDANSTLLLDITAPDRLTKLKVDNAAIEDQIALLSITINDRERFLQLPTSVALTEKVGKIKSSATLLQRYKSTQEDLQAAQHQLHLILTQLSTIDPHVHQLPEFHAQYSKESILLAQYTQNQKNTTAHAALVVNCQNLTAQIDKLSASPEQLTSLKLQVQQLTDYRRYYSLAAEISKLIADSDKLTQILRTDETSLNVTTEQTRQLLTQFKTMLSLHQAHNVSTSSADHCPLCQQVLTAELQSSLAKDRKGIEDQIALLTRQLVQLEKDHTAVRTHNTTIQNSLQQICGQLSALNAAQKHITQPPTDLSIQAIDDHWTQTNEALALVETNIQRKTHLEGALATAQEQLTQAAARLNPQVVKPNLSLEQLLELLKLRISQLEPQQATYAQLAQQRDQLEGKIQVLRQSLSGIEQQLDSLGARTEITLTPEEEATAQALEIAHADLLNQRIALGKQQEVLAHVQKSLLETNAAITHLQDTQNYSGHLQLIMGVYRDLPDQILYNQLKKLCISMDAIIGSFKLYHSFKLSLTNDLDFILAYANGRTRPIGKASGGERIILGLAFRLAAHRTLAAEFPFLVIDEPTNHLDPENRKVLAELLQQLKPKLLALNIEKLILSTHSPEIAAQADVLVRL